MAFLAAAATAGRYFVDRRAGELLATHAAERAAQIEAERKTAERILQEQLAAAEARVREAKEEAAAAAARTEALRLAQEPRSARIKAVRATLLGRLRARPPGRIRFRAMAGDPEAAGLAAELYRLFADGRWAVEGIDGVSAPGHLEGILVRHGTGRGNGAEVLALLRSAGLETEEAIDEAQAPLEVTVFFKPLSKQK